MSMVSPSSIEILYASESYGKTIFLAGPTPRDPQTPSWRTKAVEALINIGFHGQVIVPEPRNGQWSEEIINSQIQWEWEGLLTATVVAFWVPREMAKMPALTTNVEFGLMATCGKVVLGYPLDTPHMGYLAKLAARYKIPVRHSLTDTMIEAAGKCSRLFNV